MKKAMFPRLLDLIHFPSINYFSLVLLPSQSLISRYLDYTCFLHDKRYLTTKQYKKENTILQMHNCIINI